MDPFSVTAGVLGLVATSSNIVVALKGFVDASRSADSRIHLMIAEVELFKRTLQSMNETLGTEEVRPMFQSTGHLSTHWSNIVTCLDDGQTMLRNFEAMLDRIDKNAYFMNTARKTLRLKEATEDIYAFQQHFRCCRDTIQISLQAALLWNQMTTRETITTGADLPDLAELTRSINRLAHDVSGRMISLEKTIQAGETSDTLSTLVNMKKCVQSSAKVASSASSIALTMDDAESIASASDLYGIFDHIPDPETVAWVTSTSKLNLKVQEHQTPSLAEWCSAPVIYVSAAEDSDYEGEIEVDIANLHIRQGHEYLQKGDYAMAEQELGQGLRRLRRPKSRQQNDVIQADGLDGLVKLYRQQGRWQETKEAIIERLSLLSRTATTHSTDILREKLSLAEVLLKLNDPVEARLHVRACITAYRKLGAQAMDGLERSYRTMIEICIQDGDADGQRDYTMLLGSISKVDPALDKRSMMPVSCDELESSRGFGKKEHPKTSETLPRHDSKMPEILPGRYDTSLPDSTAIEPNEEFSASLSAETSLKSLDGFQGPIGQPSGWDSAAIPDALSTISQNDHLRDLQIIGKFTAGSESKDERGLLSTIKRSRSTQDLHNNHTTPTHLRSISDPEPANWDALLSSPIDYAQESNAPNNEGKKGSNSNAFYKMPFDSSSGSDSTFSFDGPSDNIQDTSFVPIEPQTLESTTAPPRVRALFVGHSCSGKTSLISRCLNGLDGSLRDHEFTPTLTPYVTKCSVDNNSTTSATELVLWDSPGPLSEALFPESIQHIATGISCVVLCFAVDDPDLISDIDALWAHQIHEVFPGRPVILVGTKVDIRSDLSATNRTASMEQPCNTREGLQIQDRIGAVTYLDCSVKTGEGVQELMKEIAVQGMRYRKAAKDSGRFKVIWRKSREWLNWKNRLGTDRERF